jgi:hypothetical protein
LLGLVTPKIIAAGFCVLVLWNLASAEPLQESDELSDAGQPRRILLESTPRLRLVVRFCVILLVFQKSSGQLLIRTGNFGNYSSALFPRATRRFKLEHTGKPYYCNSIRNESMFMNYYCMVSYLKATIMNKLLIFSMIATSRIALHV